MAIVGLSAMIAKKRLDLDLADKGVPSVGRYSGDWAYVRTQVNVLPSDLVRVMVENAAAVKTTDVYRSRRMSLRLKPIIYKNVEYPVEAIVYEKDGAVVRGYYACFNGAENVSYIRSVIGRFDSEAKPSRSRSTA